MKFPLKLVRRSQWEEKEKSHKKLEHMADVYVCLIKRSYENNRRTEYDLLKTSLRELWAVSQLSPSSSSLLSVTTPPTGIELSGGGYLDIMLVDIHDYRLTP